MTTANDYDDSYALGGHKKMYARHWKLSPYLPIWQHIIQQRWIDPKDPVVDLGCGVGQFAHFLYDHQIRDYQGIDFSTVAIDQARERLPEGRFTCADLIDPLTIIPQTKTAIYTVLEVFEHIDQDLGLINRIPTGTRVVYSVPNYNSKTHVRTFDSKQRIESRYGHVLKTVASTHFEFGNQADENGIVINRTIFLISALRIEPAPIQKYWSYTDGHSISSDFPGLAASQSELTFNTEILRPSNTHNHKILPFTQIKWVEDTRLKSTPVYEGSYDQYLTDLLKAFKQCFINDFNPGLPYLFTHSSGADSRILSGTMLQLKKEGFSDFSNVRFRTMGLQEADSFRAIMAHAGWENFDIIDDNLPDPYDIGNPAISTWGFCSYTSQLKFWRDFDPSQIGLIGGAMGEVLYQDFDHWYFGGTWFSNRAHTLNRAQCQFQHTLFPMLDPAVLSLASAMPPGWRNKPNPNPSIPRDQLRWDLVTRLNMHTVPVQVAPMTPNISAARKQHMTQLYKQSRFYRDFKIDENLFPSDLKTTVYGLGPKCWGFGVTVYDPIIKDRP